MKKWILLLVLGLIGVAAWYFFETRNKPDQELTPKMQPLAVSKHSAVFNESVNKALEAYYNLSEALVNWDSATVNNRSAELQKELKEVKLDELQKDTTGIYETAAGAVQNLQNDVTELEKGGSLTEKRRKFHSLSGNLYDFLRVIDYDGSPVYLQECPMAFNENETAQWISRSGADEARRNPYLGTRDPKYGKGMLACGTTIDSLRFMKAQ